MARNLTPKSKIERKYNEPILNSGKVLLKKNYPAGQHGRRRSKLSEYALQLKEKQKVKYIYGLLERQFHNTFKKAVKQKGVTGSIFLQILEARLDNIVFRLGLAPTRRAARQLVSHCHIQVNGKRVNIPSYILQQGDLISLRVKSQNLVAVQSSLAKQTKQYPWLLWDAEQMQGRLLEVPARELIPEKINEQSIIELYSK